MDKIKTIYCDFDGTITKKDAVNTFFEMYADKKWLEYEQQWIEGKISSQENAIKQIALIQSVSKQQLKDYIDSIEIDPYFLEFTQFLNEKNIQLVILSDGFDLFIQKVLEKNNVKNVKFFANHLIHNEDGTFSIEFPHFTQNCDIKAGMCKCAQIKEKEFFYIGDGTSDLCVAKKAKVVFATKNLKKYCEKNSLKYHPFDTFDDIIKVLKKPD